MAQKRKTDKKIPNNARPGNKNALRHGFYAKRFFDAENKALDDASPINIESEIALLRVCVDRLTKELDFGKVMHKDQQMNQHRDDHYLQQLNTLSIMTQSISSLARTHFLMAGKSGAVLDSIQEALNIVRQQMGI